MQRKQFFTPNHYLIIFPSRESLIKLISSFFSVRERLQDIQREKKNRRWSILEALKDVMNSITSRFRGSSKSGVSLDKLVDLIEDHEVMINTLEITPIWRMWRYVTWKRSILIFIIIVILKDIMTDTSSKQKDADEVFSTGASSLDSGVLTNDQAIDLQERMSDLNRRWNVLNIDVIQREKRLDF